MNKKIDKHKKLSLKVVSLYNVVLILTILYFSFLYYKKVLNLPTFLISAGSLFIFIILGSILIYRILKPVNMIIDKVVNVFKSDLLSDIKNKKNINLNSIIDNIDEYFNKYKTIIDSMKDSSSNVVVSTKGITSAVDKINKIYDDFLFVVNLIEKNAKNQANRISDLINKVKEIIGNFDHVSLLVYDQTEIVNRTDNCMMEISSSIQEISNFSSQITVFSDRLLTVAESGRDSVTETMSSIMEIEKLSNQIFEIVRVISKIAEQTNLLAMNASIEAAHAGSSGEGFAVVADEVRKLAISSSNQAKEIINHVKNIAVKIRGSVDQSSTSVHLLEKILLESRNTSNQLNEIVNKIGFQSNKSKEVGEYVEDLVFNFKVIKSETTKGMELSSEVSSKMTELMEITDQIVNELDDQSIISLDLMRWLEEIKDKRNENEQIIKSFQENVDSILYSKQNVNQEESTEEGITVVNPENSIEKNI